MDTSQGVRKFGDGLVVDGFKQLSSESYNRTKILEIDICVAYHYIARAICIHENSMNYLSALDPYQWPGNKWYKYGNQTQYLEDFVHAGICMFTLVSFSSECIKYKIRKHNHKPKYQKLMFKHWFVQPPTKNYFIRVKPQYVLCIAYWLLKR